MCLSFIYVAKRLSVVQIVFGQTVFADQDRLIDGVTAVLDIMTWTSS